MAILLGHTGSGKTTLMNWLNDKINKDQNFISYYIPKPPKTNEDLVLLFKTIFRYNLIDSIMFGELNIQNLQKFLIKRTIKKKTVILFDESHEASLEVLEWLRTLNDMVPNLIIVFAALPSFEKKVEAELPTLWMRFTTKIYLESLNKIETESLIRKRIEDAGGNGFKPFTEEAIRRIFEISGGFPREIIKICDRLINEAAQRNITSINLDFVNEYFSSKQNVPEAVKRHEIKKIILPDKQKIILEILNKTPDITPNQIVDSLDKQLYKNKDIAIRSVNNILRRMMRDDLVNRKKMGNSYVYSLSGKAKSIFAEA
ncbi:MAG: AAA family ATPase [Candidatus Aenigmatarchaeota archaeon]